MKQRLSDESDDCFYYNYYDEPNVKWCLCIILAFYLVLLLKEMEITPQRAIHSHYVANMFHYRNMFLLHNCHFLSGF